MDTVIFAADVIAYVFVGVSPSDTWEESIWGDLLRFAQVNLLVQYLSHYLPTHKNMSLFALLLVDCVSHYGNDPAVSVFLRIWPLIFCIEYQYVSIIMLCYDAQIAKPLIIICHVHTAANLVVNW